jgi:hypothetical protein
MANQRLPKLQAAGNDSVSFRRQLGGVPYCVRGNENPITTAMCMSPIARPSTLFRHKKWLVFVRFEHIWRIYPITSGYDSLRSTLHLLVLILWPAFVISSLVKTLPTSAPSPRKRSQQREIAP